MADSIKNRLLAFIKEIGSNPRKFSMSLGKSEGYVRTIKGNIGSGVIGEILRIYPQLNANWLIIGSGEMLIKTPEDETNADFTNRELLKRIEEKSEEIGALKAKIKMLEDQLNINSKSGTQSA